MADLRTMAAELRRVADALDRAALEGEEWVSRATCGLSGRHWDRLVAARMPVVRRGRGFFALRSDVQAAHLAEARAATGLRLTLVRTEIDEIADLLRTAGITVQ